MMSYYLANKILVPGLVFNSFGLVFGNNNVLLTVLLL